MASHLAGLGNVRDMSREEVAALAADAYAAVKERAAEIIADKQKPIEVQSRRRFEQIAMAMVIHRENAPVSVTVSPDGDPAKACAVPLSKVSVNRETEEFALVYMPGWIAIDRHFAQGAIPTLTDKREWTAEQREAWKRVRQSLTRSRENSRRDALRRKYGRRIKIYDTKLPSYRVGE